MKRWGLAAAAWLVVAVVWAGVPASGTIRLSDLQDQFGGSNPISLSEYYRGGGLVPNTGTWSSVPTSGAISLSNFYASPSAQLPGSIVLATTSNNPATGINFDVTGALILVAGTGGGTSTWLLAGSPSAFEVQLSGTGSTMPIGEDAINTWLNMSTPRHWGYNACAIDNPCPSASFTGQLRIRLAAGGTVIATANPVTMSSNWVP